MAPRPTRFSDVCGTMDELKRLLREERQRVGADPDATVAPLLEDAVFMLGRMEKRADEYGRFRRQVRDVLSRLDAVEDVESRMARDAAGRIGELLTPGRDIPDDDADRIDDWAERIRDAANAHEHRLRHYKDLALQLHDQFHEIAGHRPWASPNADAESVVAEIERRAQAWLPPEPHRGKLLADIARGHAYVVDEPLPDGQPIVQFVDGGSMPMSQIRWNDAVENFHPASFPPGPTGRQYRDTTPAQPET